MDLKTFIELTNLLSEQNQTPPIIGEDLVQKNPVKDDKAGCRTVQLGNTTLVMYRSKSPRLSEAQQQGLYDQFKKTEKPLEVLKSEISESPLREIRGGDLGKSGPGPRAKADAARNAAKTGGGLPFAQGFTPQRQYGSHQVNRPLSCRNNVELNGPQFDRNHNRGGASSSMETLSRSLSEEYIDYQQKFNDPSVSPRFDTRQYDEEKFRHLAKDPKAPEEVFGKTTVDEARTAIHAEIEGIIENVQRMEKPICKSVDLDFKIDGPAPFTHLDIKHPVGSEILSKQNNTDTVQEMAYKIGKKLMQQKDRFCGLEQGPETSENVLHIIDMAYVSPPEKEIVREYCLEGAGKVGGSEAIIFLNDK